MKTFKIMSWNVRGVRDPNKGQVVRNVIHKSHCDIVCIQELKLNENELDYIAHVIPYFFSFKLCDFSSIRLIGGLLYSMKKMLLATKQLDYTTHVFCSIER
jgi:Endonuclease/Exonuclease/phosphatase family